MHILLATGGSLHSTAAVRFGAQIIAPTDPPPTVLSVAPTPLQQPLAEQAVAQARMILLPKAGQVYTEIRTGRPTSVILQAAQEMAADLLILGESPKHRLTTRLLGSVSMQITGRAPCSVLIVKGRIAPIERVLVCTSGATQPSVLERFIEHGFAERIGAQAEVTILHVMSQISAAPAARAGRLLHASAEDLMREKTPEGEILLRNMLIMQNHARAMTPKVRHGLVVDEILAEAAAGDYQLVVIGAHRAEGWERFLLEDLAHEIVARIGRPVLLVR
ncbi:MAG: universal stress protein [Caldilineaceae bacterium]